MSWRSALEKREISFLSYFLLAVYLTAIVLVHSVAPAGDLSPVVVVEDTPLFHHATIDLNTGGKADKVSSPLPGNWQAFVTQADFDHDGERDDIRITGEHRIAPHEGETESNVIPAPGLELEFLNVVPPSAPAGEFPLAKRGSREHTGRGHQGMIHATVQPLYPGGIRVTVKLRHVVVLAPGSGN